ncbi:hypothetical protein [Bdellovibrio sp. HCB274]|uniref:hypothetical protein n=1 Tax=Bdellovibrio sp. HCB274 TaxID=3394361 RepID=UPI0039B6910B
MKLLKSLAFILLGSTSTAYGNAKVIGNGGKIVVCTDSANPQNMKVVDLYEAQLLRGWIPQVPAGAKDPVTLAGLVIERIKNVNPTRYERYKGFLATFLGETRFIKGQELIDIPDSDHPSYPENCKVQQVATQRVPLTSQDARYLINNDLWEKMDLTNQAALVLHEIIYREQILVGINTSATTRFINSALWANVTAGMNQAEYFNLMKDFIADVDFEDFNFAICRPGFVDGTLHQCARREMPTFARSGKEWFVKGFVLPYWSPLAQEKKQYFNLVDPKTNTNTRFIVFGPYKKTENGFTIPHAADWLEQIGVNEMKYQGHEIRFLTNLLPSNKELYPWYPRNKECYELWECQPERLDSKIDGDSRPPIRIWSTLAITRDLRILNFHVDYMLPPMGHAMKNCRGLVSLHEDGTISRCTGDGTYQDKDVKLVFEKTNTGFDKIGRIEYALWMTNAQAFVQNKWIPISSVDWYGQGKYYFNSFSTKKTMRFNVDGQDVEIPAALIVLNEKGEITRFQSSKDDKPVQLKYGNVEIPTRWWYMSGTDETFEPSPAGSRLIRLAVEKDLKDSHGNVRTYQPQWEVYIDKNAVVLDCKYQGRNCF